MRRLVIPKYVALLAALALVAGCSADGPPTAVLTAPVAPNGPTQVSTRSFPEAPPGRGDSRTGWVIFPNGQTRQVGYVVYNGEAYWQGDIVLGRADEISPTAAGAKPFMRSSRGLQLSTRAVPGDPSRGVAIDGDDFRWPGGVVPYEIDGGLTDQQRVTDAIRMIEDFTGGVTLVPRSGQADYVRFVEDTVCSSRVGQIGGMQRIRLAPGCASGSTAHEILHALGVFHEQSRCDRDSRVDIQWANIESGLEGNFDMECDNATDIGDYDFGSLMHYPLDAFSSNGQQTMRLRPGITYSGVIGQRDSLAVSDRFTLNFLYGLNNKPPVPVIAPWTIPYFEGDSVLMDASGTTDPDDVFRTYTWNFNDGTCGSSPGPSCRGEKVYHRFFTDANYKIGLFVWDGYTLASTESFVTIKNFAPKLTWNNAWIDEGDSVFRFDSFEDPGDDAPWKLTLTFGDGSTPVNQSLPSRAFMTQHRYLDNGDFTMTASVTDDDDTTLERATVRVDNVEPDVDAGADLVVESGQSLILSGSFSDPGILDSPWNWSVNWGFGQPTTGVALQQGAISSTLQACMAGTYNATLSVTDKDGGVGSDALRITVGYVQVVLDNTPGNTPNPLSLKNKGAFPVAILSSATFDATTIDVSTVRLGDEQGTDTPVAKQKGRYLTRTEDVNDDGRLDLVLSFSVPVMVTNGDLTAGTTSLVIRGSQGAAGGGCVNFRGSDTVVVVS